MKRIFIAFGHHNTKKSFNAAIRDTFIDEAKKKGHVIDLINLHEEKPIPFFDGTEPSEQILNYRKQYGKPISESAIKEDFEISVSFKSDQLGIDSSGIIKLSDIKSKDACQKISVLKLTRFGCATTPFQRSDSRKISTDSESEK